MDYADVDSQATKEMLNKIRLNERHRRRTLGAKAHKMSKNIISLRTFLVQAHLHTPAFPGQKAWGGAFGVGLVTQYVGAVTALSRNISNLLTSWGQLEGNVDHAER